MNYLVGIDGGGTGCRAVVCDRHGKHLGTGSAGPANIMSNFEAAQINIVSACENAFNNANIPTSAIADADAFLGLAGANAGDYSKRTKENLPFRNCIIENDAVISLEGAIGAEDGAVAIIGTGSVFIYRIDGIVRTIGGWGYMIGDLGSGSRLGRELLQETLLAYDKIHDVTDLTEHLLTQFNGNPTDIVEYAHNAQPSEFGVFAPLIFEYAKLRDPVAQKILRNAVRDVEETLEAILVDDHHKFCMLGGLGKLYADLVNSNLKKRIHPPLGNATSGAAALAVRNFTKIGFA
jgi:glucosamine kinase